MDKNSELTFFSFKKSAKLVRVRFGCGLDWRIYGILHFSRSEHVWLGMSNYFS
jgi:hypothetical protein